MSAQFELFNRPPTLSEAQAIVENGRDNGIECPCCGQFAKIYRRKINSMMARGLIELYRQSRDRFWIDIKEINRALRGLATVNPTSDFAKLAYWGFVADRGNDDPDKRRSGIWSITEKGKAFACRRIRVPEKVFLYNGESIGFSSQTTDIVEALGKKFSYWELMRD